MCTVTFIAGRQGYLLGMNRDEKLTRPAGLAPREVRRNQRTILAPIEPTGGTWIGVNDAGVTLALINWYSISARVTKAPFSRGDLVKNSLPGDTPALVEQHVLEQPLHGTNPFRLIGVFPATQLVVEWRWDLAALTRHEHPWQSNTWISSGYDEAGAQRVRYAAFIEALGETPGRSREWLRRLHRSHGRECGPYSHCMHREDAATVSFTEVEVDSSEATMRYTAGAPCTSDVVQFHRSIRLDTALLPVPARVERRPTHRLSLRRQRLPAPDP